MVGLVHHHVAVRQHRFTVAVSTVLVAEQVALHVRPLLVELLPVVLRVDEHRVIQRDAEIQHRLQHLVFDLDELERLVRCLFRLCRHDGHRIAHIAQAPVKDIAVIGGALRIALTCLGIADLRHVLPGQHARHAGYQLGPADVNGVHQRAGVGGAQQLDHKAVLWGQILRVDRLTGHKGTIVLLADGLIDHPQLFGPLHAFTSRFIHSSMARSWLT